MQINDPWKTPPRRRVTARHTGWAPELEMRNIKIQELLQRHHEVRALLVEDHIEH